MYFEGACQHSKCSINASRYCFYYLSAAKKKNNGLLWPSLALYYFKACRNCVYCSFVPLIETGIAYNKAET